MSGGYFPAGFVFGKEEEDDEGKSCCIARIYMKKSFNETRKNETSNKSCSSKAMHIDGLPRSVSMCVFGINTSLLGWAHNVYVQYDSNCNEH